MQCGDKSIPLVVDLDGTLVKTDLLFELFLVYIKGNPFRVFNILIWAMNGKAYLKEKLSSSADVDVSVLPYESEVVEFILEEKSRGRVIVLATASHILIAKRIADYLGFVDAVLATEGEINLASKKKAVRITNEFGEKNFDYMGNSMDDLAVWRVAKGAVVVNPNFGVERIVRSFGNVIRVIKAEKNFLKLWGKAARFHQWVKNFLIFLPIIAAHQMLNVPVLIDGVYAFFCFGLCASSVYILNDLMDLNDDRHHATKKNRPFAAGDLAVLHGLILFPVLLIASFILSWYLLPISFLVVLSIYYVLTVAYSFYLKRKMALDVITLSMLYTIRIVAGAAAVGIKVTSWLLAFSMFIFLSLALVKRFAELKEARLIGKRGRSRGRGYYADDLEMIAPLGASAGYMAVLVLALYIQDTATKNLYSHPEFIWAVCPVLLFWTTRIWLITHRGEMHDDPVVFAAKDKVSLFVGVLFALIFGAAI